MPFGAQSNIWRIYAYVLLSGHRYWCAMCYLSCCLYLPTQQQLCATLCAAILSPQAQPAEASATAQTCTHFETVPACSSPEANALWKWTVGQAWCVLCRLPEPFLCALTDSSAGHRLQKLWARAPCKTLTHQAAVLRQTRTIANQLAKSTTGST